MKDTFANKIPIWKKEQKEVITKYGDKILGTCSVEQAYGGMRSVKSMVYETSLLDPVEVLDKQIPSFIGRFSTKAVSSRMTGHLPRGDPQGIRFRGLTIAECRERLPKATVSCAHHTLLHPMTQFTALQWISFRPR